MNVCATVITQGRNASGFLQIDFQIYVMLYHEWHISDLPFAVEIPNHGASSECIYSMELEILAPKFLC